MDEIQKWLKVNTENTESFIVSSRYAIIKHLLIYNLVIWSLYFNFNYVHQKDYSKFDMSRITQKLADLKFRKLCVQSDEPSFLSIFQNEGFILDSKDCLHLIIKKHEKE